MARTDRTTDTLALWHQVKARLRKAVERLTSGTGRRDPERFDEVLYLLERDARLKAELLDELREATRLSEIAPVHPSSQVDFAELVRSTTESLAVVAHEQGITLHVRCAATSIIISADAGELTHVVARLLASAVASSVRASTIRSELSLSVDWIRLVIRASVRDAVLTLIPQALESSSRDAPDVDSAAWEQLGLSAVRRLVERHGGIVRVEKQERELVFTLSIPGDRARPPSASRTPEPK